VARRRGSIQAIAGAVVAVTHTRCKRPERIAGQSPSERRAERTAALSASATAPPPRSPAMLPGRRQPARAGMRRRAARQRSLGPSASPVPGGHVSGLPPITCRCKWSTVWPARARARSRTAIAHGCGAASPRRPSSRARGACRVSHPSLPELTTTRYPELATPEISATLADASMSFPRIASWRSVACADAGSGQPWGHDESDAQRPRTRPRAAAHSLDTDEAVTVLRDDHNVHRGGRGDVLERVHMVVLVHARRRDGLCQDLGKDGVGHAVCGEEGGAGRAGGSSALADHPRPTHRQGVAAPRITHRRRQRKPFA